MPLDLAKLLDADGTVDHSDDRLSSPGYGGAL
jgi:hypothetical protein